MRALPHWMVVSLGLVAPSDSASEALAAATSSQLAVHPPALTGAAWVENRGQWPEEVLFMAQQPGLVLRAERGGLVLQVERAGEEEGVLVRVRPRVATEHVDWEALEPLPARHHWFLGNDRSRWVREARSFAALRWPTIVTGVDLRIEHRNGRLTHAFEATGRAGEQSPELLLQGARELGFDLDRVHDAEALSLCLGLAGLEQRIASPTETHPVGIAPGLEWSTYLGGSAIQGDSATDVAFDGNGDVFVLGLTFGPEFPQTPGTFQRRGGRDNVFLVKLRGSDGALLFSSMFGGTDGDSSTLHDPVAVTVDSAGNPVVAGESVAWDFPVSPTAFDAHKDVTRSGFVLKLSASGDDVLFSTLLEGETLTTNMVALHVGPQDSVAVTGSTKDPTFPTTTGAYQEVMSGTSDVFLTCLDASGSSLVFSTWFGGSGGEFGGGLDQGADGTWTIAGRTGSYDLPTTPGVWMEERSSPFATVSFVARFTADASELVWATYFGADNFTSSEIIETLAVDALGGVTFGGATTSVDFPTTQGAIIDELLWPISGFLSRFSNDGARLLYSTYFGTANGGGIEDLFVDASGMCTAVGGMGPWFPTTPGAYDTDDTDTGLGSDAIVTRVAPGGDRFFYSSYLGGPGHEYNIDIAVTPTGRAVLSGRASAPGGFPTTPGTPFPSFQGGQSDAFVTVMDLVLEGAREYGRSTPSCLGPVRIAVTERPTAGAATFGLYASGAPPDAQGWLLVATRARDYDDAASNGAVLLVDPAGLLQRIPVTTDEFGFVETPWPLTGRRAGEELFFQFLFANPQGCSTAAPDCASFGLAVRVQR